MQHLFNFAIELEDEKIVERISDNAEKQIVREIGDLVKEKMFHRQYSYKTRENTYDGQFTEFAKDILTDWLRENKTEIIEKAAELLAKKLSMSKAAKAIQKEE